MVVSFPRKMEFIREFGRFSFIRSFNRIVKPDLRKIIEENPRVFL
jgi:hypothetical protein